jgi:hypothetical protein
VDVIRNNSAIPRLKVDPNQLGCAVRGIVPAIQYKGVRALRVVLEDDREREKQCGSSSTFGAGDLLAIAIFKVDAQQCSSRMVDY